MNYGHCECYLYHNYEYKVCALLHQGAIADVRFITYFHLYFLLILFIYVFYLFISTPII